MFGALLIGWVTDSGFTEETSRGARTSCCPDTARSSLCMGVSGTCTLAAGDASGLVRILFTGRRSAFGRWNVTARPSGRCAGVGGTSWSYGSAGQGTWSHCVADLRASWMATRLRVKPQIGNSDRPPGPAGKCRGVRPDALFVVTGQGTLLTTRDSGRASTSSLARIIHGGVNGSREVR